MGITLHQTTFEEQPQKKSKLFCLALSVCNRTEFITKDRNKTQFIDSKEIFFLPNIHLNSSPFTKHLPKATQKWPYQRSAPTFTPAVKHSLTNRFTWNYTQVMFTCRWLPTSIAMMWLFMDSQSDSVIILMKNVNMLKSSSTTKTCVVDELCSKTSRNPTPTTGSQLSLLKKPLLSLK